MAEVFRELYPAAYYARFLENALRPDGRDLAERRPCSVAPGTLRSALGSATVKLGRTTVVCGVTGQVGPRETPTTPLLALHVELTALSSPDIRPGPPTPHAAALKVPLTPSPSSWGKRSHAHTHTQAPPANVVHGTGAGGAAG